MQILHVRWITILSPSDNSDYVEIQGENEEVNIQVINNLGQVLAEIESETVPFKLNLNKYTLGIYYVHIRNENNTKQKLFKVIKQ